LVNFVNNKAKRRHCARYARILLFLILCFSQGSVGHVARVVGNMTGASWQICWWVQ